MRNEGGLGYCVDKTKTPTRAEGEREQAVEKDSSEIAAQEHWTAWKK